MSTFSHYAKVVSEFALEFHTIAVGSGWNDAALKAVYNQCLTTHAFTMLVIGRLWLRW